MRVDRSYILLDAGQSVSEGLDLVCQHPNIHYVIVRREESGQIYWYSFRAFDFVKKLEGSLSTLPLRHALVMHENTANPEHHEGSIDPATFVPGAVVVNARGRVVGVLEIVCMAEPRYEHIDINVNDLEETCEAQAEPPWSDDDSLGDNYNRRSTADSTKLVTKLVDKFQSVLTGHSAGAKLPIKTRPSAAEQSHTSADTATLDISKERRAASRSVAYNHIDDSSDGSTADSASSAARLGTGDSVTTSDDDGSTAPEAAPSSTEVIPPADKVAPDHRPFAVWPDLITPEYVEKNQEFTLEIGFERQQQAGVVGGPVVIVDAPPEFDLRVQVVGVGFAAPEGWVHELHVIRDNPYTARIKVKLIAEASDKLADTRTLAVLFYYESNLCGQAQRSIMVATAGASNADRAVTVKTASSAINVPVQVKNGLRAPDLTVTIHLVTGRSSRESFLWSFESPHSIPIPETSPITELDQAAGQFVDALLQQLVDLSDGPTADNEMRGIARQIERKVPPAFWIALKEVARAIAVEHRAPDVLFVTEETRLPWELAWMREPLDPSRPNHLGAQVNFGRWILGNTRPSLPPEDKLLWHHMVVVVGNYPAASGLALPDAVGEARTLVELAPNQITPIELNGVELDPFLEGDTPPNGAEIIHFACHGKAQSGYAAASSLAMQNGKPFTPATLGGSEIGEKWEPFLFLNACEVGCAGVALGETAGFAGTALYEGFRAFVGPLWEVDSKVAREIAVEFYTRTLDQGEPVAAVLRDVRSKYLYRGANAAPSPDTYLAYVYYGHPALRFERQI